MALINRVSRLFRADLHAVLDRIEEPGPLLRQAVREMEEALARDEQRERVLAHEQERIDARAGELERSLEDLAEQLDVCFESGSEDLARKTIRRRLESERLLEQLGGRREALVRERAELAGRCDGNRSRLDAMRQKADLLAGECGDARPEEPWSAAEVCVHDEVVEVAFLRELARRRAS